MISSADVRFATNPSRVTHRDQLDGMLAERFARLSSAALMARLDAAGIANARMNTVQELAAHPQLVERGRWLTVQSPVGRLRALAPPVVMEDVAPVMNPIPAVGEHTDAILRELGLDADTIAGWRERGIV